MTTFTKWFLLNSIVLTATFFAETMNGISVMVKNDSSYLTIVIMLLYVAVSGFVGKLCYLADNEKTVEGKLKLTKLADIGWFCTEHFFTLGLLGTIIGLCMATDSGLVEGHSTGQVITSLKKGLSTAFYTTVCGIVFSLPLQIQLMILKDKLEKQ